MLIETEKPPNEQTRAMGELIRKARKDAGLTQAQLAKKFHRKRLAVSEMENGTVEIRRLGQSLLASSLDKTDLLFFRCLRPEGNHIRATLTTRTRVVDSFP